MGRKKLGIDEKKRNFVVKLHPSMIKKIHDVALDRDTTIASVVDECLSVLNKI